MFLFEIAISFELFQEKLSLATKRRLLGTVFETRDAVKTLELMLRAATAPRDSLRPYSGRPYIGPNLLKILFDRQMEHIQSCQAFIRSLQVFKKLITLLFGCLLNISVCIYDALLCKPHELPVHKR